MINSCVSMKKCVAVKEENVNSGFLVLHLILFSFSSSISVKYLERFIEVWMPLGRVKNGGRYVSHMCSCIFEVL